MALSVVAGHIAGVVLRCWYDRDHRQLWFLAAVAGGIAACVPVLVAGATQADNQIAWILRPDLDLTDFAFFGRNLFYSTSVATALIILWTTPARRPSSPRGRGPATASSTRPGNTRTAG